MKNGDKRRTTDTPPDILERTFKFAVRVVKLCLHLEQRGNVCRVLGGQILRAGTSVGSMVEEAQAAESKADFNSKMSIGLKEAREVHYRLRVLTAADVIATSRLTRIIDEAGEIKRVIGAIITSSKRNARRAS